MFSFAQESFHEPLGSSCKLLRDRASALQSMSLVKIREECAEDPGWSEPMMTKEALVFTSRHCIDKHFGDVPEFDQGALRTQRSG
jgi:hypothetical protein